MNELKLDVNIRYFTWIEKLTKVFKKECYAVSTIITNLCFVDKDYLTFFNSDVLLHSAITVDDVFSYIKYNCKYCDFTIVKAFIDASKCTEAMKLMNNYTKEVENTVILESDLKKLEYEKPTERQELEKNMIKLKLVCEMNEMLVKEYDLITETLSKCFMLPKASILLLSVIKEDIIYKISSNVREYLMEHKIIAYELKPLSALKIRYLIIDEMELHVPLDCDTKVDTKHSSGNRYILM